LQYQEAKGLTADGIAGPDTIKAIKATWAAVSWWPPNNEIVALLQQVLVNQSRILASQTQGIKLMSQISDAVAALQAQVTQSTSVEQSALTLIQGIAAQLAAALANAADDASAVAAVTAVNSQLQTSASALAAAVAANTPATPATPKA
jgi:hypothetical protein